MGPFPSRHIFGLYKRGRDPLRNPSRHLKKEKSELTLKCLLTEDQGRRPTATSPCPDPVLFTVVAPAAAAAIEPTPPPLICCRCCPTPSSAPAPTEFTLHHLVGFTPSSPNLPHHIARLNPPTSPPGFQPTFRSSSPSPVKFIQMPSFISKCWPSPQPRAPWVHPICVAHAWTPGCPTSSWLHPASPNSSCCSYLCVRCPPARWHPSARGIESFPRTLPNDRYHCRNEDYAAITSSPTRPTIADHPCHVQTTSILTTDRARAPQVKHTSPSLYWSTLFLPVFPTLVSTVIGV